jgi:polyhydroxyalkanoate synthesis regulator phasin
MPDEKGISENLREAIERTFAATAESAAETRGRAQDLLDEVSRRGQGAREAVTQRGQEARETVVSRVVEAVEGMRLAGHEEVKELEHRVAELSARVAALEAAGKAPAADAGDAADPGTRR